MKIVLDIIYYISDFLEALFGLNHLTEFSTDLKSDLPAIYMSAREVVLQHCPPVPVNIQNTMINDNKAYVRNNTINYTSRLPEIPLPTFSGNLIE